MDKKGKDSYRFKEAGAVSVALTNNKKIACFTDNTDSLGPLDIAERFFPFKLDLVIIEGGKKSDLPKIEIIVKGNEGPLYTEFLNTIIALVSDDHVDADFPCFTRDDIEGISRFIEETIIRDQD
jgi:molybdopterin-guanine dinucleotide biosynthesis protein B